MIIQGLTSWFFCFSSALLELDLQYCGKTLLLSQAIVLSSVSLPAAAASVPGVDQPTPCKDSSLIATCDQGPGVRNVSKTLLTALGCHINMSLTNDVF